MGYYNDPYSSPEKYGLEIVGEVEWYDEPYEFDMTVVWKDKEGQLYYASDSGCSCPSPFEDFDSVQDLTVATKHEILTYLGEHAQTGEAINLIEKVAAL
jgi:hypothetical protein